jgi:mycothiol synthase
MAPMPDLHFRNYVGPGDFPAMVACANASFAADGTDVIRTVEDMARDYSSFIVCVPTRDVWIAQAGSEIAGYVRCWHWRQADGLHLYGQVGFVAPHWRRQGVGTALLAWLEEHQRGIAAGQADATGHAYHSFVREGEVSTAALLGKSGYHLERHFFTMLRPTLDAIADFPLAAGVEVRPVEPAHHRAIWDSHVRAFQTHWGFAPPKEEDYQWWLKSPVFQPQLWQVAWDTATNEVVGQVRAYIDASYNATQGLKRGWTEFISVSQGWRRRGLARALIARSLRAQKAAGMQDSGLGVDAANHDGATRVYEDCGFAVTKRNAVWRKAMALR